MALLAFEELARYRLDEYTRLRGLVEAGEDRLQTQWRGLTGT